MTIKKYLSAFLMAIAFTNCSKAIIDENPNPPEPITKTIYYNPDVQTVMTNNCITCHSGAAPSAGLRLDNYTDTRYSTEHGNLIERMNSSTNPMPPSGILSADTRQIMDKWVIDGFKEN